MALYRVKSMTERMRILENCRASLSRIIRACVEAQAYHDNCSDFTNRTANIEARMTAITADVNVVIGELTDLIATGNMAFQYTWTVGRHGIKTFFLDATADTLECRDALATDAGAAIPAFTGPPLVANDVLMLTGTSLNDERLTVASVVSNAVTFTSGTVDMDEDVEAAGAELKKIVVSI